MSFVLAPPPPVAVVTRTTLETRRRIRDLARPRGRTEPPGSPLPGASRATVTTTFGHGPIRRAAAITGLSVGLAEITHHALTPDKLPAALFGGLFIGEGIGLTMRRRRS